MPETARNGVVAAVNDNDDYHMHLYVTGTGWHTLTQKGGTGDTDSAFKPAVDSSGNISWTNNASLPNPITQNMRVPQSVQSEQGPQGIQGIQGTKRDPLNITKTYASVVAMNEDFNNMQLNDYAMIKSEV